MAKNTWNPWKMTAIGMGLVAVTALVTGLVVASLNHKEQPKPVPTASRQPVHRAAPTPTAANITACNDYARSIAGDKTTQTVTDAVIGGALGAGVGAATGAIAGGGKRTGKGAAIGGLAGVTAGTLYGINQANANDARYAEAYRACMRGRG